MMATQSKAAMIATDKMIPMPIALRSVAPPLLLPPTTCIMFRDASIMLAKLLA